MDMAAESTSTVSTCLQPFTGNLVSEFSLSAMNHDSLEHPIFQGCSLQDAFRIELVQGFLAMTLCGTDPQDQAVVPSRDPEANFSLALVGNQRLHIFWCGVESHIHIIIQEVIQGHHAIALQPGRALMSVGSVTQQERPAPSDILDTRPLVEPPTMGLL